MEGILKLFEPLFTAADGWIGVTIIFGAFALFWFVGIHGPSIVEPAIAAITYANIEANFKLLPLVNTQIKLLHQVHKCLSLHLVVRVQHWSCHLCLCG